MDQWEVVARERIRDLVARYNANGDSGRFPAVIDLFLDDASLEIPGATYHGKTEILGMFESAAQKTGQGKEAKARFIRHFTATLQIDVESETSAKSRCYYAVLTERGLDHWGRYIDKYRRLDGQWLFWHRRVTVDGAVAAGWGDSS